MEGENRSMNLPGYYSSGQFARMANVSIRTIRFYDKQNILKPSYVNPSGARFYTDSDFARLAADPSAQISGILARRYPGNDDQ